MLLVVARNHGRKKAQVVPARVPPAPRTGEVAVGVHTPHPHKYTLCNASQDAPRCIALRSFVKGQLKTRSWSLMNMVLTEPKTRLMAQALNKLVGANSALILIPEKIEDMK